MAASVTTAANRTRTVPCSLLPGAVDHDCRPNPEAFIDRRRLAYDDHGSPGHDWGGRPVAGTRMQEIVTKSIRKHQG